MTADAVTWVLAVLQLGTAVGIAVFWVTWLRSDHDEPWLPAGFVEHERAFVVPDSALGIALASSAVLNLVEHAAGRSLALIAVGMLTFLGLVDAAYFARTGLFARDRGGVANAAVVAWMLLLAALLAARHA